MLLCRGGTRIPPGHRDMTVDGPTTPAIADGMACSRFGWSTESAGAVSVLPSRPLPSLVVPRPQYFALIPIGATTPSSTLFTAQSLQGEEDKMGLGDGVNSKSSFPSFGVMGVVGILFLIMPIGSLLCANAFRQVKEPKDKESS
ncbi:hypothetical protein F4821DRAFT_261824 [Hypoxylon rubiginosum]|uniref:Uncharacterized protein n=1 Tax=Hypoxylon rubiginosum TaxID=110542 RepID=A0ACC0CVX5_9PEZI|nr:hypothetical protein F4821DRAFT_261824 [Hypoxylon rubiginosum]